MLKYFIPLLLLPGIALAQERPLPHGYTGGVPDYVQRPGLPGSGPWAPPANVPPPEPLFNGELTPAEQDLIAKALDRLAIELKADDKTVEAAVHFRAMLLASPHETLQDIRALPTIGMALSRATNVEVDKVDANGINIIDNAASRAASKPYCDLLKKLNPKAGCVIW